MVDKPKSNIFTDIAQGKPASILPHHIQKARNWYRDAALAVTNINSATLFKQNEKNFRRTINISSIGSIFTYYYDPKWKAKLKYYDMFPLAIICEVYNDGWSALNVHYISPIARAKLFNSLLSITEGQGPKQKIQLSYDLLKSASRFRYFKPCYKRYLASNVRSRLLFIEPSQWPIALYLPTQRFVGASEDQIWKESEGMK